MEISAGVFVGKVNGRVREALWERTVEMITSGRAVMIRSNRTEQGLDVRVHGHHWEPVDFDGVTLMLRPHPDAEGRPRAPRGGPDEARTGWSKAARRYKYAR
ncbi:type I-E CRISPR-associated endoribonuclease Cas2e [Leucobacter allii]|uniref:type I-E CRISPR-associated endoribonuclease Cas2e n=1 Tax=Leucobacter allii TaxID=2932247 RepID=UPI001FD1F6CF|nr:type I-E CRISPR-associated endoribonuclease Cas2e [Leucobacter allii]UOR01731.1 type I-E CRISPR-associated endoribonuclease Cas2e [Leucobacter allii]